MVDRLQTAFSARTVMYHARNQSMSQQRESKPNSIQSQMLNHLIHRKSRCSLILALLVNEPFLSGLRDKDCESLFGRLPSA